MDEFQKDRPGVSSVVLPSGEIVTDHVADAASGTLTVLWKTVRHAVRGCHMSECRESIAYPGIMTCSRCNRLWAWNLL